MSVAKRLLWIAVCSGASLAAAEPAPYQRALQGDEARQAEALQKQADDMWAAGKFAEALEPAEKLLALRRRVQGEGHQEAADAARLVETLKKVASLPAARQAALAETPALAAKALALHRRGKPAEAEPLFRKVLAVQEEVLGPRHLETAASCTLLALNLDSQGQTEEAESLLRKALDIRQQQLGPRNVYTATSAFNLAYNLERQDRSREAEPLWLASAEGVEAARLMQASSLARAAIPFPPYLGLAVCRARLGRPAGAWDAAETGLTRVLENEIFPEAIERSRRTVLPREQIQERLAPDTALVLWLDSPSGNPWGCVLRHSGPPAWVRLPGSGPGGR
jgi:tetratricopeptide (TPR) repeat protein